MIPTKQGMVSNSRLTTTEQDELIWQQKKKEEKVMIAKIIKDQEPSIQKKKQAHIEESLQYIDYGASPVKKKIEEMRNSPIQPDKDLLGAQLRSEQYASGLKRKNSGLSEQKPFDLKCQHPHMIDPPSKEFLSATQNMSAIGK